MRLDHSTIYANYNTRIEMYAVTDGFTPGKNARIIGSPQISTRSGHGSPFYNEGAIHFTSYTEAEDLAFRNAGLLAIEADRTSILGSEAQFSNTGEVLIVADAELWLNINQTGSNNGRISIGPGGQLRTNVGSRTPPTQCPSSPSTRLPVRAG